MNSEKIVDKTRTYPCLMETNGGKVVLFHAHCSGTVVYTTESTGDVVGVYSASWDMSVFKPFKGKVVLSG